MKKLILTLSLLFFTIYSYAATCVTRYASECSIEAKQVFKDSGGQYTCQWLPDNVYPYYGICELTKIVK